MGEVPSAPATLIRQATRADAGEIRRFIRDNYGRYGSFIVPDRWNWQYLENPRVQGERIPLFIAVRGTEVVGITSGIPVELKIGDAIHDAKWSCEMMVLPSCRGQGLGLGLQKEDADHTPIFISVRMAPSTRYIQGKIGCVDFDPVRVYVRVAGMTRSAIYAYLRLRTARKPRWAAVVRGLHVLGGDAVMAGLLNLSRGLRDLLRPRPGSGSTEIREVERFGPEIDALWEATKNDYEVISKRDHAFLNWKTFDHPYLPYRGFLAVREGEVRGYVILRLSEPDEPNVGHIIDLYAARKDRETLNALVGHAVDFVGRQRAVIQCETTIPEFEAVLRGFGFRHTGGLVPTVRCLDPGMQAALGARRGKWFITRIDQDLDQLRPIWAAGVRL
jgi:GNAT superfamily N-acetyltransferase